MTSILRSALHLGDRSIPSKLLNLRAVAVMAEKLCSIDKRTKCSCTDKLDRLKMRLQSIVDGTSNITLKELLEDFDAILDKIFPAKPSADSGSSQPVVQDPIQMANANGSKPVPQTEIQIGGSDGSQPHTQVAKDTAGSSGFQP